MEKLAICFGAGKTGRGFAAHLAFLSGYNVVLVDKDDDLVNGLKEQGEFLVQVLGNSQKDCVIKPLTVFNITDEGWTDYLVNAQLAFVSVFGNNLEELAKSIAPALSKRHERNPEEPLNFITCENYAGAASFLKEGILHYLNDENLVNWLAENIGFSESMILRTCLNASEDQNILTVRAQDFFELPCDGEAFTGKIPELKGLKPLKNFGNQLRRKIYTYNCINAVITYLGAEKGYTQLFEAGNDPEIVEIAKQAAQETSSAQIAEFGFDPEEQKEWEEAALAKFADSNLPDPIDRNGADPARKLTREDRLIGPALLALKYDIEIKGLLAGIISGFNFFDSKKNVRLSDTIEKQGIDFVLENICGLKPDEKLYSIIKEAYLKTTN
jgi:mannitol-1-phosphate 5-dehydrogenase